MLKMIIADDEKIIRDGLMEAVDWNSMGIEVVGLAQNGEAALSLFLQYKPDIVITDIRMPHMDGLEFIKKIREFNQDVKIIILTGYDDFSYAQQSIKNNVFDYLLKPVKKEVLKESVQRAADELLILAKKRAQEETFLEHIHENLPVIRERFFKDLTESTSILKHTFDEKVQFLGLDFTYDAQYFVLLLDIDDYERVTEKISELNKQIIDYSVFDELQHQPHIGAFKSTMGRYGLLFQGEKEAAEQIAQQIKGQIEASYGISVTVCISEPCAGVPELPKGFAQAKNALKYKVILGNGQIIWAGDVEPSLSTFDYNSIQYEDEILFHIKNLDAEEMQAAMQKYTAYCLENISPEHIKIMYLKLFFVGMINILQMQEASDDYFKDWFETALQLDNSSSVSEMSSVICEKFMTAISHLAEKRCNNANPIVDKIIAYLNENYDKPLSLKKIAAEVYLTPNYICNLFRKHVGKNIGDYLNEIRIEKAKELLRDPRYKIYEISNMVGYTDSRYFGTLFKKHTGIVLSEYRKNLQS